MVRPFGSNSVAGFDVGEGQGEKQNAYPDDNDVHCAVPYFGFVLGSAIGRAEIP